MKERLLFSVFEKKTPESAVVFKISIFLMLLLALGLIQGCSSWKVKKAFEGEYSSEDNNKLINDYCQTCHIHNKFSSGDHLDEVPQKYKRKVFRYATECRTCHYLDISWVTDKVERRTRRPKDANRGMFRSFEIDTIKDQKERRLQDEEEERRKPIEDDEEDSFLGIF